ncbi:MAG: hypothetical protein HKN16_03750, partial [Saprospiraceae bacterium]|nr:hypothetical protein [Saprospiraceae bacterium]
MQTSQKVFQTLVFCIIFFGITQAQDLYPFEPTEEYPYGRPNPEAPAQLLDFAPLIGECDCKSLQRIDQTTWKDTINMVWRFKYIMNGMAIQDETLKEDGTYAGSIRQFNPDSTK